MALNKVTYTNYSTVIGAENLNDIQDEIISMASAKAAKALVISVGTVSSLPITVTNSQITEDMKLVASTVGTPSSQTSDWSITTSNGSLTVSGSISGSTTLELILLETR